MFDMLALVLTLFNVYLGFYFVIVGVVLLIENYQKVVYWLIPPSFLILLLGINLLSIWVYNTLTPILG